MQRVLLLDELGEKFGAVHEYYNLRTPVDAIKLLCINDPGFQKEFKKVYKRLNKEGQATAVNVKAAMDEAGFLVGMNKYIGADAHSTMPKFPKTGGREAGKGEVYMSPAAE